MRVKRRFFSRAPQPLRLGDNHCSVSLPPSIDDLRRIEALAGLDEPQLQWLLGRCELAELASGECLSRVGDIAEHMTFIVEGEATIRADIDGPAFFVTPGMTTGLLPFSRMTHYPVGLRAQTPIRALRLHKQHFPAMYQQLPELIPRLVAILTDRVREATRATTQIEKLAAIGKLSAGLAHELNNPAAAALQGSKSAKDYFDCYRETLDSLAVQCASKEIYAEVQALEASASAAVHNPNATPLDSLTRSDLEESILTWLESIGVEEPWHVASAFVSAGFTVEKLDQATSAWSPEIRELAMHRVAAAIEMEQALAQMSDSTTRISELVKAMKEYSFMDRAAAAAIDINQNLDATLKMFSFRFKGNIQLCTDYEADLPQLYGHGGQLNQVWTNLIDNALDAIEMQQGRTEPGLITIRTHREVDYVLVEITDNGPGIPAEVVAKIYEPFFTTKPQGEGTGLGLDTVYRIIRQHNGDIRVSSAPGQTTFQVRLPISQAK